MTVLGFLDALVLRESDAFSVSEWRLYGDQAQLDAVPVDVRGNLNHVAQYAFRLLGAVGRR